MVRKQVLILLLLMMNSQFAWAADETSTQAPHAQAFLPETIFEFNPVVEGETVTHEFILRNTGDAELQIFEIKSG